MKHYISLEELKDLDQTKSHLRSQGLSDYQASAVAVQMRQAATPVKRFEASRPKSNLTPQMYAELKVLLNL